jgi:coenzyme F420-0:L-glutamate ligase/coenzyme F420-1:gamma-L-glutamate ligase
MEAFGVPGIGEVRTGDDVAGLLLAALAAAGQELADGDVVVLSSKVVSKADGLTVAATTRDAAVDAETVRVVAERLTPRGRAAIVQAASGPVMAAAGVDASNVAPGTVLILPADPDASARRLLATLRGRTGRRVGVVVSDTLGRPWRQGQVDAAIGAAGVRVTDDLRGGIDGYGNALEVTVRAVADELAALADLVKGKLAGIPVAVVRGLPGLVTDEAGPGAAELLRAGDQDWFRYGHVEAVRAALGAPPGTTEVPLQPVDPGTARQRLDRAVAVALAGGDATVTITPHNVGVPEDPGDAEDPEDPGDAEACLTTTGSDPSALVTLGMAAQRLIAAAWSEDLDAVAGPVHAGPEGAHLTVRAHRRPTRWPWLGRERHHQGQRRADDLAELFQAPQFGAVELRAGLADQDQSERRRTERDQRRPAVGFVRAGRGHPQGRRPARGHHHDVVGARCARTDRHDVPGGAVVVEGDHRRPVRAERPRSAVDQGAQPTVGDVHHLGDQFQVGVPTGGRHPGLDADDPHPCHPEQAVARPVYLGDVTNLDEHVVQGPARLALQHVDLDDVRPRQTDRRGNLAERPRQVGDADPQPRKHLSSIRWAGRPRPGATPAGGPPGRTHRHPSSVRMPCLHSGQITKHQ